MRTIKYKIRPYFLPLIRSGKKRHEYRLAKYKNIGIGDCLLLISNTNELDYVKVDVLNIKHYSNWREALSDRWENDFQGLYDTFEDLIAECEGYYSKEDVEEYGINVFEIRSSFKSFRKARFLLDADIIIEGEGFENTSQEILLLFNWLNKLQGIRVICSDVRRKIDEYRDEKIKGLVLHKLGSYEKLSSISENDAEFEGLFDNYSDESFVLNRNLLYQVYENKADYLITTDLEILDTAKKIYIGDRVLSPIDFLVAVERDNPALIEYDVLSVKLEKFGTLNVNDIFFDSLREDYGGTDFDRWFNRKSDESAYVFKNKSGIQGFLYLKTEDENESYEHFEPVFAPAKRLKVGTFKIAHQGLRLGERFLKIIFDNAVLQDVDEIYVTMFEDRREEVIVLMKLMMEWGFVKKSRNKKNGEIVLVKDMKNYDRSESSKFNFPLLKNDKKVTILPIHSHYHFRLFPDLRLKNENSSLYDEVACSYAIEKIYVCSTKSIEFGPGDLVCIYRMGDYNKTYTSVITGIGVVQGVSFVKDKPALISVCKNKSVFSEKELRDLYETKHYRTVIKILFLERLENNVNLNMLHKKGVLAVTDAPRLNTFLSEEKYAKLRDLGGLDG